MTDVKQTTGQCNACKGEMYYDGLNWRHKANDRPLRECPRSGPDPVEIMAQHADYVSDFARHCTCGEWSDIRPEAQGTRVPFIHHVLAQLALVGYALELPRT